jgi:hypothetical protein
MTSNTVPVNAAMANADLWNRLADEPSSGFRHSPQLPKRRQIDEQPLCPKAQP